MTTKLVLVLALVAGLGSFGFAAEISDDIWTLSPFSPCADDGNASLHAPSLGFRTRPEVRLLPALVPTLLMGSPRRTEVRWPRGAAQPASACARSVPPPQRR